MASWIRTLDLKFSSRALNYLVIAAEFSALEINFKVLKYNIFSVKITMVVSQIERSPNLEFEMNAC